MSDSLNAMEVLLQDFKNALAKKDHAAFSKLSITVSDVEQLLREHVQAQTTSEIRGIIQKLIGGENLNAPETAFLRLWLISDAESYLKYENNFQEWCKEVERLHQEVRQFKDVNLDVQSSLKMRSILLDLMRTLGDINFYLQQKERVEKFEESIKELDQEERQLLIDLLKSKVKSERY